jgi:hypothetical protein
MKAKRGIVAILIVLPLLQGCAVAVAAGAGATAGYLMSKEAHKDGGDK